MTDRQLPPEFEYLFRPEKIGPDDTTLNIPVVRHDAITQEIRGDTLRLPAVEEPADRPVVVPQPLVYIPPSPRKEPEHETGTRPSNALLGIAFSIAIGIIAMVGFSHNFTTGTPPKEPPRAEQSTQQPRPTTKPPAIERETSPVNTPTRAPARSVSPPSPQKSIASASAAPSPATTTVLPTAPATPSVEPTAVGSPPQVTPTETQSTQPSITPSEQPSTPPTAPTP